MRGWMPKEWCAGNGASERGGRQDRANDDEGGPAGGREQELRRWKGGRRANFLPVHCADRLLCMHAIAQASSGGGTGPQRSTALTRQLNCILQQHRAAHPSGAFWMKAQAQTSPLSPYSRSQPPALGSAPQASVLGAPKVHAQANPFCCRRRRCAGWPSFVAQLSGPSCGGQRRGGARMSTVGDLHHPTNTPISCLPRLHLFFGTPGFLVHDATHRNIRLADFGARTGHCQGPVQSHT